MDTILTEKDSVRNRRSDHQRALPESPMEVPIPNPSLTDPAGCTGAASRESEFQSAAGLLRPDPDGNSAGLRRLPNSTSGLYHYYGHADIRELALYVEDTITKNWTFNLGLRGDVYDGIVNANQPEPRLGIAYNIKPTGTVLRVSYARTLETPFNENLVLSSLGCNDPVINAIMSSTISPCVSNAPLSPGLAQ